MMLQKKKTYMMFATAIGGVFAFTTAILLKIGADYGYQTATAANVLRASMMAVIIVGVVRMMMKSVISSKDVK